IFATALRYFVICGHISVSIRQSKHVGAARNFPAVVLVANVWRVSGRTKLDPGVPAPCCCRLAIASIIKCISKLLTRDRRIIRPILFGGGHLPMCIIGVKPIGSVLRRDSLPPSHAVKLTREARGRKSGSTRTRGQ